MIFPDAKLAFFCKPFYQKRYPDSCIEIDAFRRRLGFPGLLKEHNLLENKIFAMQVIMVACGVLKEVKLSN
jgi:hypothetical protein